MPTDKMAPLTSLRFFAAAVIVLYHFQYPFNYQLPANLNYSIPITLFFVLSGFVLTTRYRDFTAPRAFVEYYVARVARIWPLHILLLVILAFYSPYLLYQPVLALANFLLVQSWVPDVNFSMSLNGVAWTISDEIFFYLLFPLVILTRGYLWLWMLFSATLTLALIIVGNTTAGTAIGTAAETFLHTGPPVRFLEFLLGVSAALLFVRMPRPKWGATLWTVAEAIAVGLIAGSLYLAGVVDPLLWQVLGPAGSAWFYFDGAAPLFAVAIFIFGYSSGLISKALSTPVLVLLGEASFATYMIHQMGTSLALGQGWLPKTWNPITFLATLAITYALSIASLKYFETPIRYLAKRFLARPPALLGVDGLDDSEADYRSL